MRDRSGQQIDRYRLKQQLGSGGFGEVYLAEAIRPHAPPTLVALKLLPPVTAEDMRGFLNEARTFRLIHPHIVRVLDFGIDADEQRPFLVMEYASHGTLRQRYPAGTRIPLPIVVSLVRQIASALQFAHDDGIIHRDVKPENMLLNAQNEILLTDFGIASLSAQSTTHDTQRIAGTARYMAPELFKGKARPASDQYALGILVYEWLCGTAPFKGNDFLQLGFQHAYEPVPSLLEQVPDLPPEVEQVIMHALAKDASQRFVSMQAFATALEAASQVSSPTPTPPTQPTLPSPQPLIKQSPNPEPSILSADIISVVPPSKVVATEPVFYSSPEYAFTHPNMTLTPINMPFVPVTPSATQSTRYTKRILLVILALVVIASASVLVFQAQQKQAAQYATATAVAAKAYDAYVTANGIQFGFDAAHTHFNPYEHVLSTTNVSLLKEAWTAQTEGAITSSPAVANGVVYVGSFDHKLYAFNATGCGSPTCSPLWTAQTGNSIFSSPAVANGVVYVGSDDGKLYAFKATGCGSATCSPLWTALTGGGIGTSQAVANGVVYVGSDDGKLYAFKADGCGSATCSPLWGAGTGGTISPSLTIANGVIYADSIDHKLYAFKADGCGSATCSPLWTAQTGGIIYSGPAVANGVVYVGSDDGKLYAYSL